MSTAPGHLHGSSVVPTWFVYTALAVCLGLLLCINIYDLDFGFHLAIGRYILAHGIPRTEFFVPALADKPFSSGFILGSTIIALVWAAAGPAGLVLLKALCYGGGFLFMARAAERRGAPAWLAVLVAACGACAVSTRFVERPGMFSVLLLGLLVYAMEWRRCSPDVRVWKSMPAWTAIFFGLWAFLHTEWLVGLVVYTAFELQQAVERKRFRLAAISIACAVVSPVILFALLHPAGVAPLLEPLRAAFQAGSGIPVQEFQPAVWTGQWPAMPLLLLGLGAAGWLLHCKRWFESAMLTGLIALTALIPRGALPAVLVAIPFIAECTSGFLPKRQFNMVAAGMVLAAAWFTVYISPSRHWGFAVDPTLKTQNIGDCIPPPNGEAETVLLAQSGFSSLLLSNPSIVEHGVIMDGRLEAYDFDYYRDVYLPCFQPGPGWADHLAKYDVGFYFEPLIGAVSLAGEFDSIGWKLVTWDDSGRLYARPDIVESGGIEPYRHDPARLNLLATASGGQIIAAREEIAAHCLELEIKGLTAMHGYVAVANLSMVLDDRATAENALEKARMMGAERFKSYRDAVKLYESIY